MTDPSRESAAAQPSGSAAPSTPSAKTPAGAATRSTQNASTTVLAGPTQGEPAKPKKKKHRAGRKRKNRRQSFMAPSETTEVDDTTDGGPRRPSYNHAHSSTNAAQASLYRLQQQNRSNTSLESETLLDHRDQAPVRSRRDTMKQNFSSGLSKLATPFRNQQQGRSSDAMYQRNNTSRSRLAPGQESAISEDEDEGAHDRTPLLSSRSRTRPLQSRTNSGFGYNSGRRASRNSQSSSKLDLKTTTRNDLQGESYDVNNPPSRPGSPVHGTMDDFFSSVNSDRERDAIVDVDEDEEHGRRLSSVSTNRRRRPTMSEQAERDVCFPREDMSDHAEQESQHVHGSIRRRRRRTKIWPSLDVLEEFSREEKEERTQQEVLRAKKISEPVMVGGRLRPAKTAWHHEEENLPFRFTYFCEALEDTIHARTITDLKQDMTFKQLFLPDPIVESDSSEDEDLERHNEALTRPSVRTRASSDPAQVGLPREVNNLRAPSVASNAVTESAPGSGRATPKPHRQPTQKEPPCWWLDVLAPTEAEMKVITKTFGLHQLTAEDILMAEPREKVELFPNYYFLSYRSFEQDKDRDNYLEGVNMYIVVFRTGLISFHHTLSPHPNNVRRRIRQLTDYLIPSSDWISYAIVDDITDVYGPLTTEIEGIVNDIDEDILYMHTTAADNAVAAATPKAKPKQNKDSKRPKSSRSGRTDSDLQTQGDMGAAKSEGDKTAAESGGDMLRRIGECRKTVMGLYRLLGNKADVIKGFAKRCNEDHQVAPRSEIGLFLGDIQDHIVTMTSNLSHYESLLSRAHGNYVAQINIRMNERAEQNADVLGKLTVLGTIVLPMNIITGMWGMNVWVPGQDIEGDLTWFFSITAGLLAFGLICYFIARKVYGIV